MARRLLHLGAMGARACARGALTFALWTVWLGLGILLALQIYVARTHELGLPRSVRTAFEEWLAEAGIHATFSRAIFDPSGRILIEHVTLTLPGFEEPVATAQALYMRLDPWALVVRRFEPLELRVTGVSLAVPAMLSPSGRADEIVRDLDAGLSAVGEDVSLDYLSCQVGNLAVTARGVVRAATVPGRPGTPAITGYVVKNYGAFSRQCAAAIVRLGALDRPRLHLVLSPAQAGIATARARLEAEGLKLTAPVGLQAGPLEADGSFELSEKGLAPVELSAETSALEISSLGGVAVRGLRVRREGTSWQATASEVSTQGVSAGDVIAIVQPAAAAFQADVRALLWSEPLAARGRIDLGRRTADVHFEGAVGGGVLDAVGERVHRDLRRFVNFTAPVAIRGEVRLDPGWKFAGVSARVAAKGISARGVTIDEARGLVEFDGRRRAAPEAFARVGEDEARGSYEEDIATRDYRFLLEGRLRPLDISPWILGNWWREFFGNFQFPAAPPAANIDLRGRWTDGRKVVVFVAVDSASPVVRGAPFDRVRTRLFVRPQFKDGLDLEVIGAAGSVTGTFSHRMDFDNKTRWSADLDVVSTLGLDTATAILGPVGARVLAPFAFERPPRVKVRGRLEGPGNPGGPHTDLHIEAATDGIFRYEDFPVERVTFTADVRDDMIAIGPLTAGFAGGSLAGRGKVWGRGADRRLSMEASLANATLGPAIMVLESYSARRRHRPPPPLGEFLKDKADVRLDVSASAEGLFGDPYSFHGQGTATLNGAELGQVRMLGLLSELLRFTALRFTSARAAFKIDGKQLVFPEISVTGANSGIAARGTYAMDRHELDFKARINPLQESKAFAQKFIDVFLMPLTDVLEVKLTGQIEKPRWMFVNGPSNLLLNLSQEAAPVPKPAPAPPLR